MKTAPIKSILALAVAAAAAFPAQAVSFEQNGVTLDINGTVNGFYVNRETKDTTSGSQVTTKSSGISNGLLPGWINFVATTKAGGYDVKAHISFAPGINDSSSNVGLPSAPGAGATGGSNSPFTQIDTRNNYFSFGTPTMGTFKIGRDIGMFGQNVILSDMTLIGVGGTSNAAIPFNTTFGMIGHGYMYTGFQAQVSYMSPKVSGFQAGAGLFQPKNYAGDTAKTPGLQAMATYDIPGALPGQLWTGLVHQKTDCQTSTGCGIKPYTANGFELGGKVKVDAFEFLAYTFTGKGLGLSSVGAQFYGGADTDGNKTKSNGYFLQGTYKLGDTKFGLNYGQNKDKDGFLGDGGERKNRSYTLGVYHSLNKFITLVGEFNNEKITTNGPGEIKNNTVSLGGILFF
ncbi:porin [uncultured Aquabacterium sp.]|jgi:predicted porin|uniref:porin n=1 Tax=uncultured Aquabacterium sp. TaxID=158753 RepID=UPI00261C4EBB|nr:porin [uncultured Aquabacterium sp.]